MSPSTTGDRRVAGRHPKAVHVSRRNSLRTAQQQPDQIRGHAHLERQDLSARQRQDALARLCAEEHEMGVRRGDLRRPRHEAHAEFRKDHLQAHIIGQAT